MAADIVQVNVESKVKSKSTSVKSLNKEKKDKPSLFDQMISKNKSSKNNTSDTKTKTENSKNKESIKSTTTTKVKSSLFDKLKNNSTKQTTSKTDTNKKVSLFDKLKNSKKDISNTKDKKDIEKSINILKSNSKEIKKESLDLSKKVKIEDSTVKVNKKVSTIENKEVVKVESSLFDNLKQSITSEDLINKEKNSNSKKDTPTIKIKKDTQKTSLMDNLVNNIKTKKNAPSSVKENNTDLTKEKLSAKTFLSNQQTKATIVSKHNLEQSKKILLDDSIKDAKTKIQKSAKTLELGESKVEVISEEKTTSEVKVVSKIDAKVQEQTTFLNKVLFKQALNNQEIIKTQQTKIIKETAEVEANTKEIKSEEIQLKENANQTAIQNITNKIISARQNMKSFMSDMARKMYENYKPPVTAFKINLNPANLGSISIVMKSEKATNSISISLNTTNSSTLEVLEGAKGLLQNSLQKTFDNQSNFSLDFSQQDNQSNTQDDSDNKKRKQETNSNNEESQEIVENDIAIDDGYM